MSSRFVDTHRDVSQGGDGVQLHSHTFYEMIYCTGGSTQYLLGTQRYRLLHGDIVLIPPGVSHRPLLAENGRSIQALRCMVQPGICGKRPPDVAGAAEKPAVRGAAHGQHPLGGNGKAV